MASVDMFSENDRIRIEVLYDQLSDNWFQQHKDNEQKLRITYRNIGNMIYDCRKLWTGYISKRAMECIILTNKSPIEVCTFDHFYGRTNSGKEIAKLFFDNTPTLEYFASQVYEHCKVHRVLKSENNQLASHQNTNLTWNQAYKAVGIELIHIPMHNRKRLSAALLKQHQYAYPTDLMDICLN